MQYPRGDYTSGVIQFQWTCARCQEWHSEKRGFVNGEEIWRPDSLPGGWHKVDGEVLCPNHKIQVSW